MDKIKEAWAMTSTPNKAKLIGGAVLLGIFLLAAVGGGVWAWRDHIHDARFDRAEVARAEERAADAVEREQAIGRAQAAEGRAANLEASVAIKDTALAAAGSRVQAATEKLTEEDNRYVEALKNSGSDSVNACDRWKHNCETAKRLNLKPKGEPCECPK